jgi:hypothetical protein
MGLPQVAISLQSQHQNDWGRKRGLFDHLVFASCSGQAYSIPIRDFNVELLFGLNATGRRYCQIFYIAR